MNKVQKKIKLIILVCTKHAHIKKVQNCNEYKKGVNLKFLYSQQ